MTKATISSKGQIAIPKAIRDRLKLEPGTQVVIDVQGEQVVMTRLIAGLHDWRAMRGMFREAGNILDDLSRERAAELAHDERRLKDL